MNRRNLLVLFFFISLMAAGCITGSSHSLITGEEYAALKKQLPEPGNSGRGGNYPESSPVGKYGRLQVTGTQLHSEDGTPLQLRGVFLRALKDESKYLNEQCFDTLVNSWGINVIRIPFWPEQWYSEPSYIGDDYYEGLIDKAVALSEQFGIYCIIDWHVLGGGNPFKYVEESLDFFTRFSYKFGAKKHVLYEICNEPNGRRVTWNEVIKPYAELLIPAIKAADEDAIVIVGTSSWSQDVDIAARNPLQFSNVMYAFHFYSGSHKEELRRKVETASSQIPLFSTEWGNSTYNATGGPFTESSEEWLDMMNSRMISWCHYALTDFDEEAAMLKPGVSVEGKWSEEDLTESGRFILPYFPDTAYSDVAGRETL